MCCVSFVGLFCVIVTLGTNRTVRLHCRRRGSHGCGFAFDTFLRFIPQNGAKSGSLGVKCAIMYIISIKNCLRLY